MYNVVGSHRVFRVKYKLDGSILKRKARLVAKRFHHYPGIDYEETYSPIIKSSTILIIFTLVVQFDWPVRQIDINNAFLNVDLFVPFYMS